MHLPLSIAVLGALGTAAAGVVPLPHLADPPGTGRPAPPASAVSIERLGWPNHPRTRWDELPTSDATHIVARGDNLWTISERHLGEQGDEPSTRQIAAYWAAVITENRETLRSGDPDLIYPGEVVVLPPVPRDEEP